MATKIYCDGCDKETTADVFRVSVSIKTAGRFEQSGGDYDLCAGCAARLADQSDPTQWVRAARSKVA